MSHPIKAADTGSVPSPDHNYRCLRTELAEQLVSIFRIMFPHDTLPDEFYQHVIRKLDEKVAQDADLMRLVSEGVDALMSRRASPGNHFLRKPNSRRSIAWNKLHSLKGCARTFSFSSTVTRRSGSTSGTKARQTIEAVICTGASMILIGSKERSSNFIICRGDSI